MHRESRYTLQTRRRSGTVREEPRMRSSPRNSTQPGAGDRAFGGAPCRSGGPPTARWSSEGSQRLQKGPARGNLLRVGRDARQDDSGHHDDNTSLTSAVRYGEKALDWGMEWNGSCSRRRDRPPMLESGLRQSRTWEARRPRRAGCTQTAGLVTAREFFRQSPSRPCDIVLPNVVFGNHRKYKLASGLTWPQPDACILRQQEDLERIRP